MIRDDVIRMAMEAGLAFDSDEYPDIWQTYMDVGREEIEHFAALVAAAERESLAQHFEQADQGGIHSAWVAAAIRARGETK
jgi:hypothetical protein